MCDMQRICRALLTLVPGVLCAQQSAGTELWRIAATTLAVPPALATGGAAAFWNPAQPAGAERASVALEAIETAPTVGARGVLITACARVRRVGRVGLVFGSMSIGDLVRTSLSPDPDPGGIPYYTTTIGANWATTAGATTLGATQRGGARGRRPIGADRRRVVGNAARVGVGAERRPHQIPDAHAAEHVSHPSDPPHARAGGDQHASCAHRRGGLDRLERDARALGPGRLGRVPERRRTAGGEGWRDRERCSGDPPELGARGLLGTKNAGD